MSHPGVRAASSAIRRRAEHEAKRRHGLRLARVISANPLRVKVGNSKLRLDEDDLILGQTVQQYRLDYGIKRDDRLMVQKTPSGNWLVADIVSKTEVVEGSQGQSRVMVFTAAAVVTLNHNLGKRPSVDVVDNAGSVWTVDKKHLNDNTVELHFDPPINTTPSAFAAYFN